jgi:hypothetical protein
MPRSLKDLNADERKALLNRIWENMVSTEIASPTGVDAAIESPLGKTGPVPHDLAEHIRPFVTGKGELVSDWKILNASCAVPDAATLGRSGPR